jgi:cytochrome P450
MPLPRASAGETAGVVADVLLPLLARGAIVRRPRVVSLLDRADADRRAVRRLQRLRRRYARGPVVLRLPGRTVAMVLSPEHVHRVLDGSPEPFATATLEKRAALSRFEPHGVLVSHGAERAQRRRFNEEVLDTERSLHRLAGDLVATMREEGAAIAAAAQNPAGLGWDEFAPAWWRLVRRVVLGEGARDDVELTDLLTRLRADANWSYLKPPRTELRERFLDRLGGHLARAEPGSLASLVASTPASPRTEPRDQVPQWLFAFDAAGMGTFRALALLAAHPAPARRVREELSGRDPAVPHDLPYLRACVLESLRLWPTTPAVLRDTTEQTHWEDGALPAGTGVVVFAPFFHRDAERLLPADAFAPGLWLDGGPPDGTPPNDLPFIPFSDGPAACPGRNLVLLVTTTLLATLLEGREGVRQLAPAPLDRTRALPATLSPFRLRFALF